MGIDIGAAASTAFGGSDAASAGADTGAGSAGVGGGGEQEACQAEGEPEAAGAAGAAAAAAAGAAVAGAGVEDTVDQVRLTHWPFLFCGWERRRARWGEEVCQQSTCCDGWEAAPFWRLPSSGTPRAPVPMLCSVFPQVRLLGGGTGDAGERSTFRFTASLGTLQAVLNYEGGGCHALSQVRGFRCSRECGRGL